MGRTATTDEAMTFAQMTQLTSRLPGWLHAELKEVAKKKGISLHLMIELQMKKYLEEYKKGGF